MASPDPHLRMLVDEGTSAWARKGVLQQLERMEAPQYRRLKMSRRLPFQRLQPGRRQLPWRPAAVRGMRILCQFPVQIRSFIITLIAGRRRRSLWTTTTVITWAIWFMKSNRRQRDRQRNMLLFFLLHCRKKRLGHQRWLTRCTGIRLFRVPFSNFRAERAALRRRRQMGKAGFIFFRARKPSRQISLPHAFFSATPADWSHREKPQKNGNGQPAGQDGGTLASYLLHHTSRHKISRSFRKKRLFLPVVSSITEFIPCFTTWRRVVLPSLYRYLKDVSGAPQLQRKIPMLLVNKKCLQLSDAQRLAAVMPKALNWEKLSKRSIAFNFLRYCTTLFLLVPARKLWTYGATVELPNFALTGHHQ